MSIMAVSQKSYKMTFKPWQVTVLNYLLLVRPEGTTSKEMHEYVGQNGNISKANIIAFLNELVEDGILVKNEETGKIGDHQVYSIPYDEPELRQYLAKTLLDKLLKDYSREKKILHCI
jgi:predicted transcriptional regulator